jgi:threonine dehydrogenase-like Zn-dependent dehydrogenase
VPTGAKKIIVGDIEPVRLARAPEWGAMTIGPASGDNVPDAIRDVTYGRGADGVIDAVAMEAHGSPVGRLAQRAVGVLPKWVAAPLAEQAGVDRLVALMQAIDAVRRGGTVSIIGVYGGAKDPLPMMDLFDKRIQLRMGQAHVTRWVPEILPDLTDDDPLGAEQFATHPVPHDEAPAAYTMFRQKAENCVKVLLEP